MATTTIHVPEDLLRDIDRAAEASGVSRNRFVLKAVREALARSAGEWPAGFFEPSLTEDDQRLLDEATADLVRATRANRRSRGAAAV